MLEAQPSNHFIKAAGDKNLSRELERMYRVFKVLQNLQKFGGLSWLDLHIPNRVRDCKLFLKIEERGCLHIHHNVLCNFQ